ncbi:putative salicylate hydroxylase [Xylaria castorea]|nr:putative salicylate hydroxylase [Xylaria castorea]
MDRQYDDSAFSERRAVRSLSVIVVGAGIGGLALGCFMRKTGHDVGVKVILERRMEIAEVGAGIQIPPNSARILRRFGLLDETMKHATVLERNNLRRWKDDEELGSIPLVPDVEDHFGAPLAVIHRADLQRVLFDAAIRCGCTILKDHEVIDVDQQFLPVRRLSFRPWRVHVRIHGLKDTWMSADLVLAADGMNSIVRRRLAAASGYVDQLVPIGESAYRFLLPKELVKHDETVMNVLNKNQGMRYLGPGGHIMAYPLRNNTLYNVVLVRTADSEILHKTSWTTHGKKEKILECYREWCPLVRALISHVPSSGLLETPMSNMLPLPTWKRGKIALAGDACHYMLPYVAQGAANAIEDAGTLAMAFTCTDRIELALELYQLVRKDRSERIQASAGNTGHTLHLPDGEEQRRRDESIRAASRGMGTANPDQLSDRESREFMWKIDVMAETINRFDSLAQETNVGRDR